MEAGSALDRPARGSRTSTSSPIHPGDRRPRPDRSRTGFEFMKEGAKRRVCIVTDAVIRGTGLIEKVEAGVADGGLEVAGVFDDVPQDSSTEICERCAAAAKEAGADSFLAVGGGSVMDTAKVADAIFTPRRRRARVGGLLPAAARGRRHGRAAADRAARLHPHDRGHRLEVSMAAVIKDPETEDLKLEIADFPLFPRLAILDPDRRAPCRRPSPRPPAWTR